MYPIHPILTRCLFFFPHKNCGSEWHERYSRMQNEECAASSTTDCHYYHSSPIKPFCTGSCHGWHHCDVRPSYMYCRASRLFYYKYDQPKFQGKAVSCTRPVSYTLQQISNRLQLLHLKCNLLQCLITAP